MKIEAWYSFCSTHQGHDPQCIRCIAGSWSVPQEKDIPIIIEAGIPWRAIDQV